MGGAPPPSDDGIKTELGDMSMKLPEFRSLPADQQGRVGYILLWALGVPIPVLFLFYLLRGCT